MPKNLTHEMMQNRVVQSMNMLVKKTKAARTDQITPNGYLPLPVHSADPTVTKAGQMGLYYNSSTGKVRKSYNGGAWADTTI